MSAGTNLNYHNFKMAAGLSMLLASILLMCSFYIGKNEFFLMLNGDLGAVADFIFNYFTYVGDGILWVIWLIAVFARRRRYLLPLLITSFVASTMLVQVCKQLILPFQLRPSEAISHSSIHFIKGVTLYAINSFPSGHTATAFTFALLVALLTRSSFITMICLLAAALVGYTRIYQGQHFPLDVGAGIIVAVVSVSLAAIVQQQFYRRREPKIEAPVDKTKVM
jgi:membrane-associated phospholipid phosphatase